MNCSLDMQNDLHTKTLYPRFAARIEDFLNKLKRLEYSMGVFSSLRSYAEQEKLYAQGRTAEGKIITFAKPGFSYHNFGCAADLVWCDGGNWSWNEPHKGDWDRVGLISKEFNLHWGGNFEMKDKPHFENNFGLTLKQMRELYSQGGLKAVWTELDHVS